MAAKKQATIFEDWRKTFERIPDAEPPVAPTQALETFLLGEGVEPPPPPPPVNPHANLWMLGTPTYQRKIAFTQSVGGRFGDIGLTCRFLLDRWSETPDGFVWTLDPSAAAHVVPSPRAADLLQGCFTRTQSGLAKLAVAKHGGDMDGAIIQAIDEHMQMLGLDRFIPEEPQEAW